MLCLVMRGLRACVTWGRASVGVIQSTLELGTLQQHLHDCVRPGLEERCAALCSALSAHFPDATYVRPQVSPDAPHAHRVANTVLV
jgi:hypothetical protein